ncbi:MAG: DUF454 family protein [Caldimonas sp.]
MIVIVWRMLAVISLGLGLIGLALPVVPQIPFLLLAAAAAAKGWPWFDQRLLAHPRYGPLITGWRERRALPFSAKAFATAGFAAAGLTMFLLPVASGWRIGFLAVAAASALWIWSRPER